MEESPTQLRLAENEVIFKKANEAARNLVAEQNKQYDDTVKKLPFLCECSNFACHAHIKLGFKVYRQAHANSSRFITKPGHEDPRIERVVKKEKTYFVVEKFVTPPDVSAKARPTKR